MRPIIPVLLIVGVAGSGCATKKYVGKEVGEVNAKVDTLSGEVEKTQERVKRNEVRIDEVNQDTQAAKAGAAEAKGAAQQAMVRATEAEKAAKGKLIYTVTLSNDKVTFPLNRYEVDPTPSRSSTRRSHSSRRRTAGSISRSRATRTPPGRTPTT